MRQWLITARKEKGFSQADMAKAIHVSQPSYWAYEHGESVPKPEKAKAIGSLLGFPWTKFYE